jgi:hypothetical protein
MNRHIDFDSLQDYREGLLSPGMEESARAHLGKCPECQRELEALDALLEGLGEVPLEAQPSRDLWPQIEWRIGAETGSAKADPKKALWAARKNVTLAAWQLMAASLAMAVISGGAVWVYLTGSAMDSPRTPLPSGESPMAQAVMWGVDMGDYQQAVADLEGVLQQGREVLDEETVRILEENLETIDRAIREAQDALSQDPGSKLLRRLLSESLRRKVDLLRHAATAIYANT